MIKPVIFFSHSAKEPEALDFINSVYALLMRDGKYDVLFDRERLQDGADWRDDLHTWLGRCHGALLFLSPHALESSPWVRKEMSVLTWRRDLDQPFRLLPVFYPPVSDATVRASKDFEPLGVTISQGFPADAADALDRIEAFFAPLADTAAAFESPIERVQRVIAQRLKNLDASDIEYIAGLLGKTVTWDPAVKRHQQLAREMFHVPMDKLLLALETLAPYLPKADANAVVEYLAPFWVNPVAVAPIPSIATAPQPKIAAAIAGSSDFTGEMYVKRARCNPVPWPYTSVTARSGADALGAMKREIYAGIRSRALPSTRRMTDQQIDDHLRQRADSNPVFIIVVDPVASEVMRELRAAFPTCTFIRVFRPQQSSEELLNEDTRLLIPELSPEEEAGARMFYDDATDIVSRLP